MSDQKVIVIGIDGGTWHLIDKWIDSLPTFKFLKRKGVVGTLKSSIPPTTFPAWKVYSTGKNPPKLGMYWFSYPDWSKKQFIFQNSASVSSKEIWDYLGNNKLRVGVINMPTTFPVKKVNGFMIAGIPIYGGDRYTYPRDLQSSLERKYNYKVFSRSSQTQKTRYISETKQLIQTRFEVAKNKLNEVDFLHLTLYYTDQISHYFWNDPKTKEIWELIDYELGQLLEDNDITLFIMSDHGMGKIDYIFNYNQWLLSQNYLNVRFNWGDILYKAGINRVTIKSFAAKLGILGIAKQFINSSIWHNVPLTDKDGLAVRGDRSQKIDWINSSVIGNGYGLLYFNPQENKHRINKLLKEIEEKLVTLKSPSKEKVIRKLIRCKKSTPNSYDDKRPALIMLPMPGYTLRQGIGGGDIFKNPEVHEDEIIADHTMDGIFVAYGDPIQKGTRIEASLCDLAPTILHLMKCPINPDMDGQVLKDIFEKDSEPFSREIRCQKEVGSESSEVDKINQDEKREIVSRLEDLGYL